MKRFTLHIIFLLGFLLTSTGSHAQKNRSAWEQHWQKLHQKIENSSLEVVKKSFNEFQNWAIQHHQDSILLEGILGIGVYYEKQGAFGERIKWYQYALDSLCGDDQIQCVKIRRELASIYAFIEQYGKAIGLHQDNLAFLGALKYYDAQSLEYSLIAKNHLKNENYTAAETAYLNALKTAKQANNLFYVILAHNNLGFFYAQIADFKNAESYYLKGIQILEEKDSLSQQHKAQLALLKGNLGGIYIQHKAKVEQGIAFLKEDIRYNFEDGEFALAVNATVELAKFYYENNDFDKADEILQGGIIKSERQENQATTKGMMVPVYYWLFKTHLEASESQKALHYFKAYDSLKTARDDRRENRRSNIEKSLLENILNVQLEFQKQQVDLKNKENEILIDKNKHFFYRLLIGLIAFIILALVILLFSRKRISLMRMKKELAENKFEIEKLEKQKTKIELQFKNKDLTDFGIDISRKQEILSEVKAQLKTIFKDKGDEEKSKKKIKTLIHYVNNNMLVDKQLKDFQDNVEEVNYKFLDRLQEKHPELTALDKNICGLIRLGLSNKEIATMRNVSYKAIRMSRYRIRKKLGISTAVDLVEFLKSIE